MPAMVASRAGRGQCPPSSGEGASDPAKAPGPPSCPAAAGHDGGPGEGLGDRADPEDRVPVIGGREAMSANPRPEKSTRHPSRITPTASPTAGRRLSTPSTRDWSCDDAIEAMTPPV